MNIYKLIHITYNKLVSLVLSKLTNNFTPKLKKGSIKLKLIDVNKNDLNLNMFTIKTLDFNDFKTLLLNFNNPNIVSVPHFLATPPCHIFLFDSDGKMFLHFTFYIHKPNNEKSKIHFDNYVFSLRKEIFKHCVHETMKKNVSALNYKFYMHISTKNDFRGDKL